jgi:hypothetical protein
MKLLHYLTLTSIVLPLIACSSNSNSSTEDTGSKETVSRPVDVARESRTILDTTAPETVQEELAAMPDTATPDLNIEDHFSPPDLPAELEPEPDLYQEVDWGSAGNGCLAIVECAADLGCSALDQACWLQCALDAPDGDVDKVYDIYQCMKAECPDVSLGGEDGCLLVACGVPVLACIDDFVGDTTCGKAYHCMDEATDESGFKMIQCFSKVSLEEKLLVEKLLTIDKGLEEMYWLIGCLGGQGEDDCLTTVTCMQQCGFGSCMLNCVKQSSPEGKETLQAMYACDGQPCMDQFVTCVGGQGDQNCGKSLDCMSGCDDLRGMDSEACMTECLSMSSPDAAQEMIEFFLCADQLCPEPGYCAEMGQCMTLCTGLNPT